MSEMQVKNRKGQANGNRKILVAAVCVVLSLAVIVAVSLAAKNPFFLFAAEKRAENGDFSQAAENISKANGEKADVLEKYIMLRLDIISAYPDLLTEFSLDKINFWKESTEYIIANSDSVSKEILAQTRTLSQTLDGIVSGISGYEVLRADVLSMMDVFNEINRLSSKDADGNSVSFTVAEEREKIRQWEQKCAALEAYAYSVNGSESIYLLNYLIKETQGECIDLNKKMDIVIESGYTETDTVRLNIEGKKRYPDLRSSNNESVNLLEKDNYELYVYKGICRAFVESLGEFYVPD